MQAQQSNKSVNLGDQKLKENVKKTASPSARLQNKPTPSAKLQNEPTPSARLQNKPSFEDAREFMMEILKNAEVINHGPIVQVDPTVSGSNRNPQERPTKHINVDLNVDSKSILKAAAKAGMEVPPHLSERILNLTSQYGMPNAMGNQKPLWTQTVPTNLRPRRRSFYPPHHLRNMMQYPPFYPTAMMQNLKMKPSQEKFSGNALDLLKTYHDKHLEMRKKMLNQPQKQKVVVMSKL